MSDLTHVAMPHTHAFSIRCFVEQLIETESGCKGFLTGRTKPHLVIGSNAQCLTENPEIQAYLGFARAAGDWKSTRFGLTLANSGGLLDALRANQYSQVCEIA